ncbi:MAG: GGDEF domain-containing protein [Herbaspirillum sp.]
MIGFDPRSFILVSGLLGVLCIIVLLVLRRTFPTTILGLNEWIRACSLTVIAAFLFALPTLLPVFFSSFVANVFVISGIMMMYVSVARFAGRTINHRILLWPLLFILVLLAWFTLVDSNYRNRVILVTAVNFSLFFAGAAVLLRIPKSNLAERFTGGIFLLTGVISLIRFIAAISGHDSRTGYAENSVLQGAYMMTFSISLVALTIGYILMATNRIHSKLEYLASHDTLSGAYSRGAFFKLLEQGLQHSRQYQQPLALLMIDLDDFKAINDRLGHLTGDQVLVNFADRVRTILRTSDFFGRYGGEEFAVLLPNTNNHEARAVAERICSDAARSFEPRYTVSIGVTASTNGAESISTILSMADQALYVAKEHGKNQVRQKLPGENLEMTLAFE